MREVLETRLEDWGFPVRTAGTVAAARPLLSSFDPHVVISDLMLPDATGLALLESLRGDDDGKRTFILITAYGTVDTAVKAIKAGATDVLTKPLAYDALRRQLDDAEARLAAERVSGDAGDDDEPDPSERGRETCGIVGTSAALAEMWARLQVAASSDAPVLIVGESGTGKELVARAVHQLSARSKRPFVPLNAAAIPEALAEGELFGSERGAFTGAAQARPGLVELAHTGTLFLDEITEMPLALQPKLLRVLEDGKVRRLGGNVEMVCDVRLIAATNRDPAAAVEEGRFRHDLLYRVDVLRVDVPPLRDRKEDLPALSQHFLGEAAARYGQGAPTLSPPALARLQAHDWPGNVRELRNVIERAFLAARAAEGERVVEIVGPEHVVAPVDARRPPTVPAPDGIVIPHGATAAEAERIVILETLKATGNNKAEAARRLGLDVKTVRNKLKAFGADGAPGEPDE
ncbi:MAG: sigma-54-dependent Fis family transcriptional regulator [Labilithrix sp.]|nr:sigma-54-dependent Fis family transcriptional regulator [Labilithrix sp.]